MAPPTRYILPLILQKSNPFPNYLGWLLYKAKLFHKIFDYESHDRGKMFAKL